MNLIIRDTQPSDLSALLEIYNYEAEHCLSTFDLHPKSMADWENWYSAHSAGNHFAITALVGDIPVGYATLSGYREKEAYIKTVELSVYVHRDYRRRGIASALMGRIIQMAKLRDDIHTIVSVITGGNTPSINLHKKLGFTHCGTVLQVGEKFGTSMDISNYQLIL